MTEKKAEARSGARKTKKEFVGTVKSDKMDRTVVVAIGITALHPLYKKYVRRVKTVKAHNAGNKAKAGDKVRILECRPVSKEKHWNVVEILERAK
ncbi:MAG: 30S ribosomal protein S17 [Spirochaetaceae bacterium]|jgi:small subunit ribosomal protein S17|nr:30S ribosomal protein S17 [Spirochaetaceae bacterium]